MSSTERLSGDLRRSNCGIFSVVSLGYFGFLPLSLVPSQKHFKMTVRYSTNISVQGLDLQAQWSYLGQPEGQLVFYLS